MCHFLAKAGKKLSDFAAEVAAPGEKPPDSRLQADSPDAPLPRPILAKKIEVVKTAISP
jgi:hypothetical protein